MCKPPVDQQSYERVSVCSFNHADQELILEPLQGEFMRFWQLPVLRLLTVLLLDAPLIKELGLQRDSEVYGAFCKATERGEEVRNISFSSFPCLHHITVRALISVNETPCFHNLKG